MLKLEPRPSLRRFWSYGSPLLALAITVLIGVILFALLGKDPVRGPAGLLLGADQESAMRSAS